ncbi:unnamed protein product [Adineta steineri]|uniref:G-protein coupled receptors family 1 profile domain-containing protein n=1 Tax=Adineta steineri TaxID=433720 RepID=A0A814ZZ67_9BILA|nr:unnamed protein product [Adineta steineri]CAF1484900.1 unnamed protein product [Adineta steineri]
MNSSSEVNLALATDWMSTISLFILIPVGSFGCLFNIIIFTSKQLKKNSCAFYFLCTSLFELCILCFGGISRLATEHFGSTLISQNRMYCKIRSYLMTAIGTIAVYFVLLAAIDRCMATSIHVRYRAFSQIKIAHRIVIGTIIIGIVISIHSFIFFEPQLGCIPQPGVYALFYSVYLIVCTSILPDSLILIFSLWTFQNIKRARLRNVANQTINALHQQRMQKTESQLVKMMLTLALFSILIDLTKVSCYTYYFMTTNISKSSYQQTVDVFIFQFGNVFLYLNYSKSFYIYTLASHLFRKVFSEIMQNFYHKLLRLLPKNNIHPITIIQ